MPNGKKINGEERRKRIADLLREESEPQKGGALAEKHGVSRQVIVQDISLLKAANYPIIATPQGYIYNRPRADMEKATGVIACRHSKAEMAEELNILVDHGVLVKNVTVEHAAYGELSGQLMIKSRKDVERFEQLMNEQEASLLADLTDGLHLHTVEADDGQTIEEAKQALKTKGFLVEH
ncbi:transcription repressor NadR [Salicibibacter cibarius]|uniref:Transcription repressor NadR n=1 Tax=Salicibibacter cibarius TaxID=2743000 RepID=A0A7T6Z1P8_9BACI|nr:transcription repressor NadR [Salicibibacter cibarius]QQK74666.1 transcription repressor NadR [Salicibibacter cibarius]